MSILSQEELYEVVITLTRITVQRSTRLDRVCNVKWRKHLRNLSCEGLLCKLRFLVNHLDLRTIVKCFDRGFFANDPDILSIVYDEIVQRGLRDAMYVEAIVKKYEKLFSKYTSKKTRNHSLTCTM